MDAAAPFPLTDSDLARLKDGTDAVVLDGVFDAPFLDGLLLDARRLLRAEPSRLSTAKIGNHGAPEASPVLRGDATCWVTVELCKELQLDNMKRLVQRFIKGTKPLVAAMDLVPDYSLQFALYPGTGAGYVKHVDFDRGKGGAAATVGRKLTVILYLNESWDGGQLRTYGPDGDPSSSRRDIDPKLGRLVLFRSDCVQHEVLPSWKDRLALTFWVGGRYGGPPSSPSPSPSAMPRRGLGRLPLAVPSARACPFGLSAEGHWDRRTVFVSVASYCDSECSRTVRNLFQTAAVPSRVFVGVVWQGEAVGRWDWDGDGDGDGNDGVRFPGLGGDDNGDGDGDGDVLSPAALTALRRNVRVLAVPAAQHGPRAWRRRCTAARTTRCRWTRTCGSGPAGTAT
jgi:2OG-Fe(II) oxygenase superfamily/Glycosyltransferase (GlcNAc)